MTEKRVCGVGSHSFGTNWQSFFEKLRQEHEDLRRTPGSTRHALNFSLNAWHLPEWLWGDRLKGNYDEQKRVFGTIFKDDEAFYRHLHIQCPQLLLVGPVCNGTKHFHPADHAGIDDTKVQHQWMSSSLGYAQPGSMVLGGHTLLSGLVLVMEDGSTKSFLEVADGVMKFFDRICST